MLWLKINPGSHGAAGLALKCCSSLLNSPTGIPERERITSCYKLLQGAGFLAAYLHQFTIAQ